MRYVVVVVIVGMIVVAGARLVRTQSQTVNGQLIDLACYLLDKSNTGNVHKGRGYTCAQACAREGFPVGVLTSDGKVYKVVGELAANKNARLVPHMGHTVAVTGTLGDDGGAQTITGADLKVIGQ